MSDDSVGASEDLVVLLFLDDSSTSGARLHMIQQRVECVGDLDLHICSGVIWVNERWKKSGL